MKSFWFSSLFAVGIFLVGCATTSGPGSAKPKAVLAELRDLGVDGSTYEKIENHQVLTYTDIYRLVEKKVPSPVILSYIKSTHAPYRPTNGQLNALNEAGASADLLNYLGKSVGFFEATERSQTGSVGTWRNDPYFADPYYMGGAPFDGFWPGEWYDEGWVDGAF